MCFGPSESNYSISIRAANILPDNDGFPVHLYSDTGDLTEGHTGIKF